MLDLGSGGSNPVRGVVVTGGTYQDIPDFDPVISQWTDEWVVDNTETQVATDGWWPADTATLTTITGATQAATDQKLVILPGQFRRPAHPATP